MAGVYDRWISGVSSRDLRQCSDTSRLKHSGEFGFSKKTSTCGSGGLEKNRADCLIPCEYMNPVADLVVAKLKRLPALDPTKLPGIASLLSDAPFPGPFINRTTKSTYIGQVKDDMAHGWGVLVNRKGDYFEGFFQYGCLDVFGRWVSRKGCYYEGGVSADLFDGPGIYQDSYGITTASHWRSNRASGPTKVTSAQPKLLALPAYLLQQLRLTETREVIIFEGNIQDSMNTGKGYLFNSNELFTYQGDFLNDVFHGKGTKKYLIGTVYAGDFLHGKESGIGEKVFPDGRVYSGQFNNGLPHGFGKLLTDSGVQKMCKFERGKLVAF